jgi:hypothetical protein
MRRGAETLPAAAVALDGDGDKSALLEHVATNADLPAGRHDPLDD